MLPKPNPLKSTLVSICIPTYNGERYLRTCLDSVLSQTFEDWEIILVDDCSSDRTFELAKKYANEEPRMTLFQNEKNLGLVGNWNHCVKLANGKWIKFVFQDDFLEPDCLQKMVAVGEAGHPFVYSLRHFLFENTEAKLKRWFLEHNHFVAHVFGGDAFVSMETYSKAVLSNPFYNLIGEPTSVLLRRDLFEQFGYFNSNLIQLCDSEYWNRIATQVGAAFIPEKLMTFRVHSESATMHNKKKVRLKLEHLVYRYELAFSPYYEALRIFAAKAFPRYSFKQALQSQAQRTYLWVRLRGGKPAREAWNELLLIYPSLKQWSKPDLWILFTILINRIKKMSKYK